MKTTLAWTAICLVCLGLLVTTTGCQTSGKVASLQKSTTCPSCQRETRATSVTQAAYGKCACPQCRTVSTVDPAVADTIRAYVGSEIGNTIHVCDTCKSIVEKCPICRKQAGK